MENKEKTIISKSVRNGNIAAAIIGVFYILVTMLDIYYNSISIETIYLIVGSIFIMCGVWNMIFLISFIIFAIAKGIEN